MIPGRFKLNEQTLTVNKHYIVSCYIQSIFLLKDLITNAVWHKIFERYLEKALLAIEAQLYLLGLAGLIKYIKVTSYMYASAFSDCYMCRFKSSIIYGEILRI